MAEPKPVVEAARRAVEEPLPGTSLVVPVFNEEATLEEVKAKYKALVKQHHPYARCGDRST